ncbi:GlxA family transcriptional regulator [Tateyamaria sp.]|uniref:GlxA family transcriptional regulator n=1 Tax=Tateyamaria sp. TaxID=1929288 RepID=UPI003B210C8A
MDETNTLSLAAAVDPMRAANRQAGRMVFDWQFATPEGRDVSLTSGLTVPAAPLHRIDACDLLIVVAGFDLQGQSTPQLMAGLRRLAGKDTMIAAIDGGPWVVANAGLLDGQKATTHWEDLETFANNFPDVDTVNARYVAAYNRWTSGGAAPALDMMLHLISDRHSSSLARKVAASFIHNSRPAPTDPQLRHPHPNMRSTLTKRAHQLMEAHLDQPLPIHQIARQLGQGTRTLQTHFQTEFGTTAKAHYLTLRLSEAHRLLIQTDMSLHMISLATGFGAQSSFSRAYKAHFGQSPKVARQNKSRRS